MSLSIHEFLWRSQQEDLTLFDEPTNQMLNDITAPLCLRCNQFMQNMRIFYWLRQYQTQASTPLFFNANEQLLTVLNGSAQVILVSPLYSEKLSTGDKELWAITRSNKGINCIYNTMTVPHVLVPVYYKLFSCTNLYTSLWVTLDTIIWFLSCLIHSYFLLRWTPLSAWIVFASPINIILYSSSERIWMSMYLSPEKLA